MKNLLRLIVVALLFHSNAAQAFWGDRWLNFYDCEEGKEQQCSAGCTLRKGGSDTTNQVRYVVNQKERTVIIQARSKNTTHPPLQYENCVVLDEKNWKCDTSEVNLLGEFIRITAMAEGIASIKHEARKKNGEFIYAPGYVCAK